MFADSVALNEGVLKDLMLFPVAVAAWLINELRVFLQEDKEIIRVLTECPDYWKLKTDTWDIFAYAIVFAIMSLLPWAEKSGIGTGARMLLFLASIVGQLFRAVNVYAARIWLKDVIAHANLP